MDVKNALKYSIDLEILSKRSRNGHRIVVTHFCFSSILSYVELIIKFLMKIFIL